MVASGTLSAAPGRRGTALLLTRPDAPT